MIGKKHNEEHSNKMVEIILDDVEMTEEQEKLSKLSDSDNQIMSNIIDWLRKNRDYRDNDFTDKFKADKIIPLIKHVNYGDLEFKEEVITHKLRRPLEFKYSSGKTGRILQELNYQPRYQDHQLQSASKGIDLNKEGLKFISAQISVLTGEATSVVSKLWDLDASISKLISSLYFLE